MAKPLSNVEVIVDYNRQLLTGGVAMWYVIQVGTHQEERARNQIEKLVDPDLYDEVFIPRYETMSYYHGEWVTKTQLFIPGYLYVITDYANQFAEALREVPAFTRLLGNSEYFTPLADQDIQFICAFTQRNHRVVSMSKGVIEGDEVKILQGPLMNHTGLIQKIDRHKRLAFLNIQILGREVQLKVGLEIVSKR